MKSGSNNCIVIPGLTRNLTNKFMIFLTRRWRIESAMIIIGVLAWSSCNNGGHQYSDTPTSGEIKIAVDESYSLLFDTEIYTFQSLYKYAKINASYEPETEAVKDLLNDSIRFAVISRELNEDEKKYFEGIKLTPRINKIAVDAVALIVNNNNQDTLLTLDQIKSLFSGKDTLWSQINSSSKNKPIRIVFDNSGSGNARFIKETILNNQSFPKNCFAVKSNPEVIEYVSNNPDAMGVIGVNWVSDKDDTLTISFLKKVKVVAISKNKEEIFYKPYQAYMQTGNYPFCRSVYIVSREARAGLGTGFASFVAGDKGQRIILKSGLVPATAPVRIVEITN